MFNCLWDESEASERPLDERERVARARVHVHVRARVLERAHVCPCARTRRQANHASLHSAKCVRARARLFHTRAHALARTRAQCTLTRRVLQTREFLKLTSTETHLH
eukprot:7118416-Alexandrium_andersonii.AAC.1